ncbi:DNA translocase FtsK [Atopobiaceae bacterium 24-176]
MGVALVVVAVAMAIALTSPSSAVVADACRTFLTYGFGAGAMLVPVALLLYAITFFLPSDGPVSARAAIGLALIVTAVLAMLSLLYVPAATAEAEASWVFRPEVACNAGGYWGGALAWVLLTLVGQTIGMVVLVGMVVAGIVICGFSISGLVAKIRDASSSAHEHLTERRSERLATRESRAAAESAAATTVLPSKKRGGRAKAKGDETTFIGARKTTVLRRDGEECPKRHPRLEDQGPAAHHDEVEGLELEAAAADDVVAPLPVPTGKVERGRRRAKDAIPAAETAPVSEAAPTTVLPWEDAPSADGTAAAVSAGTPAATPEKAPEAPRTEDAPRGGVAKGAMVAAPKNPSRPGEGSETFELPPLSLLDTSSDTAVTASSEEELQETADHLQAKLVEFGSTSRVVGWVAGPIVTTFQIAMGEGERVSKIMNLEDDIALALAAKSVRIFVIPGSSHLGIEIPNRERRNVYLGDVVPFAKGGPLEFAVGRDSEGKPVVADLAKMPHLLIAGTTGSGKSVAINTLIMSMLMRSTPEQLRLILVDPKRVEFSFYDGLPHLYVPVVTEPKQAASALQWAVSEMERRLKVFQKAGVRNIGGYNKKVESGVLDKDGVPPESMPYLVVVVDELSDLMMVSGKEVEASIVRIAQLARAAGIHLVLATQRPTADVVTGLIKANIESRMALTVAQKNDSRIILDGPGANRLLGNGDMLFKTGGNTPRRVLGCYVSDAEVENVVEFLASQGEPDYHDEILTAVAPSPLSSGVEDEEDEDDPLLWEAAQIVVDSQLGSTSGLQRRLKVGYARAGRIMDMLEHKGVVGPPDGSKPRDVLLDLRGLDELMAADATYREV